MNNRFYEALMVLIGRKAASPEDAAAIGRIIRAREPRGIGDGLMYDLPVIVPGYVRKQPAEVQEAWLQEASQRSTFHFQFDTPYRDKTDLPIIQAQDDPLKEWDNATRERVLTNTHAVYDRNPQARASVLYTIQFVVGDGFQMTHFNQDTARILEEFVENNDGTPIREYESAAIQGLMLDGELVFRFIEDQGKVVMIPLRPWELTEIVTGKHIHDRIEYIFNFEDGGKTPIPASQILFDAVNRNIYDLRGKPDLYASLPWLRAYKEWLEDRARQNYWRNALIYFLQVESVNPSIIAAVASRWAVPPTPGSVAVESSKVSLEAVSPNIGAGDVSQDGRQIKLMSIVGVQLPEYFLGDGANANLASTTNQELPAMTRFRWYQNHMIRNVWHPALTRVLQVAADNDLIEGAVLDDKGEWVVPMQNERGDLIPDREPVLLRDAFSLAYEPLSQDELLPKTQALQIQAAEGWIDDERATTELGNNFEDVQEGLIADAQRDQDKMAQGLMPEPPVGGLFGDDDEDGPEDDNAPDTAEEQA